MRNHKVKIEHIPPTNNGMGFIVHDRIMLHFQYKHGNMRVEFDNIGELTMFRDELTRAIRIARRNCNG